MEALNAVLERRKVISQRRLIVSIITVAIIVIILVSTIPALVIRRNTGPNVPGLPSSLLIPLYIYPLNGSWDPLYKAASARFDLNFTVIINPDDGPGTSSDPGPDYIAAVERLHALPNVQTVGYVHTSWAARDKSQVISDVSKYAAWSDVTNISVHGIFFDETPTDYSDNTSQYLHDVQQAVVTANGIQQPALIFLNPGAIPDPRLLPNSTSAITVAFEDSYHDFFRLRSALASVPCPRQEIGVLVRSVPTYANVQRLVNQMSTTAQYLFLTDLREKVYEAFGSDWFEFVQAVQA